MENLGQILNKNTRILKSQVSKYALQGLAIALTAIVTATMLASYFQYGQINLVNIVKVQSNSVTIWFLDAM
jgi:diguanylate cyclase